MLYTKCICYSQTWRSRVFNSVYYCYIYADFHWTVRFPPVNGSWILSLTFVRFPCYIEDEEFVHTLSYTSWRSVSTTENNGGMVERVIFRWHRFSLYEPLQYESPLHVQCSYGKSCFSGDSSRHATALCSSEQATSLSLTLPWRIRKTCSCCFSNASNNSFVVASPDWSLSSRVVSSVCEVEVIIV